MERCTLRMNKSKCNSDCTKCIYYSDLPKKLNVKLNNIINNYEKISQICSDASVHECNEKCVFFYPEESDGDGILLSGCKLGVKTCPFKSKRDRKVVIEKLESQINKWAKEIIDAGGTIKTKWLCDKDYLGNWCLGCKYDYENGTNICKKCICRDKYEEEE